MKKILLIVVSCLLLMPIVFASTPQFRVENLLEDEILNGEVDGGALLFIKENHLPDYYNISNITNFNAQKYDIFNWRGSGSIKIINPFLDETFLTPNAQYYFGESGVYQISSLSNASDVASVFVNNSVDQRIELVLEDLPRGFEGEFTQTSFVLTDEEVINLTFDVDDDVETGDYDIVYTINDEEFEYEVEVLEHKNWTVDFDNLSQQVEMKSGETKSIGRIEVVNIGNVDVEISMDKLGNASRFLVVPLEQTLYRKSVSYLDIQAQVPSVTKTGTYQGHIDVIGGDIKQRIQINFTIRDYIKPVIEEINFSGDKAFDDIEISVIATDNNNVGNVTMEHSGKKYFFEKDENLFTLTTTFEKLSAFSMRFCAYDQDDNYICETVKKTFTQQEIIHGYQKSIELPSVKMGKYSSFKIFELLDDVEDGVGFQLVSLESTSSNNQTPIVRIVDADGSIKRFDDYKNELKMFDQGILNLEIKSDIVSDYTGVIRVYLPEQFVQVQDITFKVSFKEYDVPTNFEKDLGEGKTLTCVVEDTGNLDTTKRKCTFYADIDIRPEDLAVPTTISERELWEGEKNQVQEDFNNFRSRNGWFIAMFVVMIIILVLFMLFRIYWFPYIRMTTGRTRKTFKGVEK